MDDLHKKLIKVAYENPGEVREALLPVLREARADTRLLARLQMMVPKWDAAVDRAVRDIIHMDDETDQKHTAEVLHQMLALQVKDLQKQMVGLKRQYKLASVAEVSREAAGWPRPKRKQPSLRTLQKWEWSGIAEATDGCRIEPDGVCEHGYPSWLRYLGFI